VFGKRHGGSDEEIWYPAVASVNQDTRADGKKPFGTLRDGVPDTALNLWPEERNQVPVEAAVHEAIAVGR